MTLTFVDSMLRSRSIVYSAYHPRKFIDELSGQAVNDIAYGNHLVYHINDLSRVQINCILIALNLYIIYI